MTKILIVEDEEHISRLIAMALSPLGYICETANDGEKGADMIEQNRYDLILLDVMLPKIDGLLIAKKRYLIPLNEKLTAELDVFEQELSGLLLVEVEFDTVEEANSFVPPAWFGEDVTNSGKYHNSYMSAHGLH